MGKSRSYWLVKQEPESYPWSQLVTDGSTVWTGVRNYQARNHLRDMRKGDWVLYYHSVSDREIVGIARVTREAYPDPTATDGDWSAVDLEPWKPLNKPVTLVQLKADPETADLPLIRQSRLSVMPLTKENVRHILDLGESTSLLPQTGSTDRK
jgi:predicted RNA-binding protein with PUA-like domain